MMSNEKNDRQQQKQVVEILTRNTRSAMKLNPEGNSSGTIMGSPDLIADLHRQDSGDLEMLKMIDSITVEHDL